MKLHSRQVLVFSCICVFLPQPSFVAAIYGQGPALVPIDNTEIRDSRDGLDGEVLIA
jgi:hypothetical protein